MFVLYLVTAVGLYTVVWVRSQDGGVWLVSAFSRCSGGTTKHRFFCSRSLENDMSQKWC